MNKALPSTNGAETDSGGYRFGTFGGVFTPSILTIFGLIMFMRTNYVVGNAGVTGALVILAIGTGITLLTGLSLSAISTNTPVAGGGAYFLISRVLGPGFGTAIGVALFVAQALSVPFYILGFVEALRTALPVSVPTWQLCLGTLVVLVGLVWVGADWALRFQYVILAVLAASIVVFMVGAAGGFSGSRFAENLTSHYTDNASFWAMFAIYFPAVTGIMAGVNMSGDLKDPARSIPLGSLSAIALAFVVYALEIILFAGTASAAELRDGPFELLVDHAWLGLRFLVIAGVFCATLSSAIGSLLGAPRVLQAVARDGAISLLVPFGVGSGRTDEPRRALLLTTLIAAATVMVAVLQPEGGGLNMVAEVVSMVFLYTYGMTNLAAFVESFGANPSFRPRFRYFHWTAALAGAVACVWAAFQIHIGAALAALAVLAILFFLARKREMVAAYGDARRGFVYQRLRQTLLILDSMPVHAKNWRPTLAVLTGNPHSRLALVTYARWLGMNCGIVSLISMLPGKLEELGSRRREELRNLKRFIQENELDVVGEVVVVGDYDRDLGVFLQAYSIGPIKPNVVVIGYTRDPARREAYVRHLRTIVALGKSIVIVSDRGIALNRPNKRIDIWWRGWHNGSLMMILAHLLMENPAWKRSRVRLLRHVRDASEVDGAREELQNISLASRIDADVHIPVSDAVFPEVLRQHSKDADLIFLGFRPPPLEEAEAFLHRADIYLEGMPSVLFVCSSGEADLQA